MQEDSNKNLTPHHFETQNNSEIMFSDVEKNIKNGEGFILLSKVAKEKKYAQEYMGLLARRGDIGSIRIGKRWYTTWKWFEEFLENSQKKKEVVNEAQIAAPIEIEAEKIICPASEKEEIKISIPFVFPEKEKIYAAQPAMNARRKEKITVAVKTRRFEMPVRKNISGDIRQPFPRMETKFKNVFVEKKNENPLSYKEINFRKNKDVFSPVFGVGEKLQSVFFPKFVFAAGFAIMVFLVAASAYFVFSDGMFKKGTVAGASSERNGGFSGISSGGEYFLASASDKMKESLSVSRVAVEAAKERENQENLGNTEN